MNTQNIAASLKEQDKVIKAYMEDKTISKHDEEMVEILMKCPKSMMLDEESGAYRPAMSDEIKHMIDQIIISRDEYIEKTYGNLFKNVEKH